jgi:TRAP-type C4-dicarboxylate transport system permease large subunit
LGDETGRLQSTTAIARYAFPFVVVLIFVSALIGFVPQISLWAIR